MQIKVYFFFSHNRVLLVNVHWRNPTSLPRHKLCSDRSNRSRTAAACELLHLLLCTGFGLFCWNSSCLISLSPWQRLWSWIPGQICPSSGWARGRYGMVMWLILCDRITLHTCIHLAGTLHGEFMPKKFLKCMQMWNIKLKTDTNINRICTRLQNVRN